MGAPSKFSQKTADTICLRLSQGETLRQICRDSEMPARSMVMRWLQQHATFRDQYAQAREALLEHWADEIVDIADDGSNDWMERETERGNIVKSIDHEHVQRSRVRVDTRKWLMSKLAPKKYGEKVTQEITGPEGGPLVSKQLVDAPPQETHEQWIERKKREQQGA